MKKISAVLIISVLLSTFMVQTYQAKTKFTDIPTGAWYETEVETLVEDSRRIIKGYDDGTFRPDGNLTVDQFITMVVRASGYDLEEGSNYWAQPFIDKALELGYISKGEFSNYQSTITREAMTPIVNKVVDTIYPKHTYDELDLIEEVLVDVTSITSKYKEDVLKCYELGIITGYEDYTFRPQKVLTRKEASVVMVRIIKPGKRELFDYDEVMAKLNGKSSYYRGGVNWIDPVTQDNYESYLLDESMLEADMEYDPPSSDCKAGYPPSLEHEDWFSFYIKYNIEGMLDGQTNDIEYLVRRRLKEKDAERVLTYIYSKDNSIDMYSNNHVLFRFDEYDVYVKEKGSFYGFDDIEYIAEYVKVTFYYKGDRYNNGTWEENREKINNGEIKIIWED